MILEDPIVQMVLIGICTNHLVTQKLLIHVCLDEVLIDGMHSSYQALLCKKHHGYWPIMFQYWEVGSELVLCIYSQTLGQHIALFLLLDVGQ